jgi:hypothetical protein
VPGAIELHLIFCLTKSEAIDFVKPITRSFGMHHKQIYLANLLSLMRIEEILIMLPPLFCLIIIGKYIALHIKYIALIFTSNEKSQSFSSQSKYSTVMNKTYRIK